MDEIDLIYYTLLGEMEENHAVSGVENAFAPGSVCASAYEQVYRACEGLRASGAQEQDVEVILDSMLAICREVGRRMYRLGREKGI